MTTIFGNNYNNIAAGGETPIYQLAGGGTGGGGSQTLFQNRNLTDLASNNYGVEFYHDSVTPHVFDASVLTQDQDHVQIDIVVKLMDISATNSSDYFYFYRDFVKLNYSNASEYYGHVSSWKTSVYVSKIAPTMAQYLISPYRLHGDDGFSQISNRHFVIFGEESANFSDSNGIYWRIHNDGKLYALVFAPTPYTRNIYPAPYYQMSAYITYL